MDSKIVFEPLYLNGHCEICNRHRSHGNHKKCSEKRKQARMERLKKEAPHEPAADNK